MNLNLTSPLLTLALFAATAVLAPASQAAKPTTPSQTYQLQVLKNCQLLQSRPLAADEQAAYLMLQQSQQKMAPLEQPIRQMQNKLDALHDAMTALNSSTGIALDTDAMSELGNQMSAVTTQFQPELSALENQAALVEQDAKRFELLIKRQLTQQPYDQLRVLAPGEQIAAGDCRRGLFYQASLDLP